MWKVSGATCRTPFALSCAAVETGVTGDGGNGGRRFSGQEEGLALSLTVYGDAIPSHLDELYAWGESLALAIQKLGAGRLILKNGKRMIIAARSRYQVI